MIKIPHVFLDKEDKLTNKNPKCAALVTAYSALEIISLRTEFRNLNTVSLRMFKEGNCMLMT